MAELITLARPYAKAAFDAAKEAGQLNEWSEALLVAAAVSQDEKVKLYLSSPSVTTEKKAQEFFLICGDKLAKSQQNFIQVMADNDRLTLLPQVAELFLLYKSNQEKTVDVDVQSAHPVSATIAKKLEKALATKLAREVKLQTSVNEDLLGGVLIRAGDTVIDSTVRGRLAKLNEALNA